MYKAKSTTKGREEGREIDEKNIIVEIKEEYKVGEERIGPLEATFQEQIWNKYIKKLNRNRREKI